MLDIEGVTISVGKLMLQAKALSAPVEVVCTHHDIGVICYTGYVLPRDDEGLVGIRLPRTRPQRRFLETIDLLIDGPYVATLHADLLGRASANQRLLPVSDRYRHILASLSTETDRSAGLVCGLDAEGGPQIIGVPVRSDFREPMERLLAHDGILVWVGQ